MVPRVYWWWRKLQMYAKLKTKQIDLLNYVKELVISLIYEAY